MLLININTNLILFINNIIIILFKMEIYVMVLLLSGLILLFVLIPNLIRYCCLADDKKKSYVQIL